MKASLFILILATVTTVLPETRAQEFFAPDPDIETGAYLPQLNFTDDDGAHHALSELGGLPVILLPIYTRCRSTCPLAVERLKRELGQKPQSLGRYQVLLFSFDPTDTPAHLKEFRHAHRLPSSWILASTTAPEADQLTKSIGFRVSRERNADTTDFVHADIVVFLSPRLRVSSFLPGDSGVASIVSALRQARGDGSLLNALVPSILIVAIFGAILCIFLAAHLWMNGLG